MTSHVIIEISVGYARGEAAGRSPDSVRTACRRVRTAGGQRADGCGRAVTDITLIIQREEDVRT